MPRPWTDTTPVSADRWNCTCEQPEGHLVCPTHGKWPVKHDTQTGPRGGQAHASPLFVQPWDGKRIAELAEQNAELAETCRVLTDTCRVLTELTQQLTNAAHHVATAHLDTPLDGRGHLLEALGAAAELGITPKP